MAPTANRFTTTLELPVGPRSADEHGLPAALVLQCHQGHVPASRRWRNRAGGGRGSASRPAWRTWASTVLWSTKCGGLRSTTR